ncbi:MAG: hypothetical protein OEZ58_17180 [Gammaproteobacteria bacterium]|nr:hypothetical protein [Gammaproteobacteria bacterium]MDH5730725.1 hypothetical protein [Gammaproteobacteria bacterium]
MSKLRRRVKTLLLLIHLISPLAYAEEKEDEQALDIEFLEFLGSFEDQNGQWVDPMDFASSQPNEQQTEQPVNDNE